MRSSSSDGCCRQKTSELSNSAPPVRLCPDCRTNQGFPCFIEEHRITPVVDREFAFDEAVHAFAHMAEQRHFGKLVINVAGS
jgi:Zinc-binding dehydrogenase